MYLLDTNIVSDVVRHPEGRVQQKIAVVSPVAVVTSIVVAAELRFGLERRWSERLARRLDIVLSPMPVLPWAAGADLAYARIRADLERRGVTIGANDLFIAAHALSLGATLVTDNVREFGRVEGLVVENWLRD